MLLQRVSQTCANVHTCTRIHTHYTNNLYDFLPNFLVKR